MKKLVIVESPAKSKTIEKYLGNDYEVLSSVGHIRDLATSGKGGLGIDVENNFEAKYVIPKEKSKIVKQLQTKAKKAEKVFLATDPDREGEAISWHLAKVLDLNIDDENRVVFNEITKNTVIKAFDNARKIDINLVKSQETRRFLDRIIGFKLSSLLKNKIKSKSAGRVQSVALRMICDREKEINSFIPQEYWTIDAILNVDKKELEVNLVKKDNKKIEIKSKDEVDQILKQLNQEYLLQSIKSENKKRAPKTPFTTSSLQQEVNSKFSYSAKKTMMIAQKLYEGIELGSETVGLITYMRTDSTRLSDEFVSSLKTKIINDYGKEYLGHYKVKNDANSQDAHEAIRPTNLEYHPEKIKIYLSSEQYKVYAFIYYRTVASLMASCINESTTYSFFNNNYEFTTSGQVMKFDGFLKVYKDYDNSKNIILPELSENKIYNSKDVITKQHFTEAPSRYSESKLIKALEEEGVGRPSTYATIVDTIVARGYVELKKSSDTGKTKYFFPTEQGILTDEKLREYFSSVINVKYTANMETELDEIALNKRDNIESLRNFYNDFEPLVKNAYEKMEKIAPEKLGENCPECGGELVYRVGRFGKFISCEKFPDCRYTRKIQSTSENKYVAVPVGQSCPECKEGELLRRKSRYGKFFLGCSRFPKCKFIKNEE